MINELPQLKFAKKRSEAEACPCGKNNKDGKFTPYIGFVNYGYCHSCAKTFLPPIEKNELNNTFVKPQPRIIKPPSFISTEIFKSSLKQYNENNFVKFLNEKFGSETTSKLVGKYFLGTSKHWIGANVFWQIDLTGKIRTGKIMLYNATTGKRVKEPTNLIQWAHKVFKQEDFELKQCFYGEHLLKDNTKHVAIVESEKTAIIASVYLPQFIWLAVGSKTNLTNERMKVLTGRKVVLFPDLNCFDLWQSKAIEFSKITSISVSDLLERKATTEERKAGLDLADYLLKEKIEKFIVDTPKQPQQIVQQSTNQIEEKQGIIKQVVLKNHERGIDFLLKVCINKCIKFSKSKKFTNVDYTFLMNEIERIQRP